MSPLLSVLSPSRHTPSSPQDSLSALSISGGLLVDDICDFIAGSQRVSFSLVSFFQGSPFERFLMLFQMAVKSIAANNTLLLFLIDLPALDTITLFKKINT